MPLELATTVEPLAVAVHSLKFAAVQLGETVAVFGAGPIGLLTIACLRLAGAARIWAVEPVAHRREMAKQMGASEASTPARSMPLQLIHKDTGGRGVDCAIDCAAKEHTTNHAIRAVRNGGRVVITGIHSAALVPFEVSPMRRKELAIFNVRRSNHESEAALELLTNQMDWFAPLVTHRRPLDAHRRRLSPGGKLRRRRRQNGDRLGPSHANIFLFFVDSKSASTCTPRKPSCSPANIRVWKD